MLIAVWLRGVKTFRRLPQGDSKTIAGILLAMWVAIVVTSGVTLIFNTSVIAIEIWILAGLLLNVRSAFGHWSGDATILKVDPGSGGGGLR
jgi:hypothetical protein